MHLSVFWHAMRSQGRFCFTGYADQSRRSLNVEGRAYVTSVAMLLTHDIRLATMAQPREEP